jgi:MFS family permease
LTRFARNTTLLYAGQFVSQAGDAIHIASVAWLAATLTGTPRATGLAVFLGALPFLLFGPFAGAFVDRSNKRTVLVASDLVRAAVLLGFPLLASAFGLSFPLVATIAFLVAAASTPFLPARDALIPVLAEGRPLVRYNAAFQTSGQLAQLVGLWVGGLLLGTDPDDTSRVVTVLTLDGATFLVSAATLLLLVVPARETAPSSAPSPPRRNLWVEAVEGLRYAAKDPLLVGLLVLTALDNLAIMGPAIVGATHLVRDDLGLSAAHVAWFEGAMAAGFLVGALVLSRIGPRLPKGPLILVGMTMDGLTYVPFAWPLPWSASLVLVFLHGLFIPCIVVGRTTLLQHHVPAARIGRTFALVHLTVTGMTALSAFVAGEVCARVGARALFLGAGVFGTLCGLAGLLAMPRLRAAR